MSNVRVNSQKTAPRAQGSTAGGLQVDPRGNLMVAATIRRRLVVTPADSDLAGFPADCIHVSADSTVTLRLENETSNSDTMLAGGMWHAMAVTRVVAATNGATVTVGWYQ